jgi:hypothetical protein
MAFVARLLSITNSGFKVVIPSKIGFYTAFSVLRTQKRSKKSTVKVEFLPGA